MRFEMRVGNLGLILLASAAPGACLFEPDLAGYDATSKGAGGVSACPFGFSECSDACVDTGYDLLNCGSCGNACNAGEVCSQGVCATTCSSGTVNCSDKCTDTANDLKNCGECGHLCGQEEACVSGQCTSLCAQGQKCNNECVNTDNDPQHCGNCNNNCQGEQICENGNCTTKCDVGKEICATACVDTNSNSQHCGSCNHHCPSNKVCSSGNCVLPTTCKQLLDQHPTSLSGDYEIDLDGPGIIVPFTANCDMDSFGGGWTRVKELTEYEYIQRLETEQDLYFQYGPDWTNFRIDALRKNSQEAYQTWWCRTVNVCHTCNFQGNWVVFDDMSEEAFTECYNNDKEVFASGVWYNLEQIPARIWHPQDCFETDAHTAEKCAHNFGDAWFR